MAADGKLHQPARQLDRQGDLVLKNSIGSQEASVLGIVELGFHFLHEA